MKILCCGFFPALQRTIQFQSFRPGEVNRAREVTVSASGKAANSARVLKALGVDPLILSFAGGANGQALRELLDTEELRSRFVKTAAETRICQTLIAAGDDHCTELVEENPPLSASEWKAFVKSFAGMAADFDRLIFSGSLPPHAPVDIYAELLSQTDGSRVVLDTSGPALLAALEHRPALVKINAEELQLTLRCDESVEEMAHELIARGAGAVGLTRGKDSARLFTPTASYRYDIPSVNTLNPIGSGDAVNAGISFALARGSALPDAFLFGLACGTANAMNMEPGVVKPEQIAEIVPQIVRS